MKMNPPPALAALHLAIFINYDTVEGAEELIKLFFVHGVAMCTFVVLIFKALLLRDKTGKILIFILTPCGV